MPNLFMILILLFVSHTHICKSLYTNRIYNPKNIRVLKLIEDPNNLFYYNVQADQISSDSGSSLANGIITGLGEGFDSMQSSFFHSLSFRLIGSLIGNLLAASVFAYISLSASNIFKEKIMNKEKKDSPKLESFPLDETKSSKIITSEAWLKLFACIFIDFIGDTSYLLPGIGEAEDLIWAPISAFVISKLFDSNFLTVLEFSKEILPGSDVIPVATLAWLLENVFESSSLASFFNLSKRLKNKTPP